MSTFLWNLIVVIIFIVGFWFWTKICSICQNIPWQNILYDKIFYMSKYSIWQNIPCHCNYILYVSVIRGDTLELKSEGMVGYIITLKI